MWIRRRSGLIALVTLIIVVATIYLWFATDAI